MANWLRCLAVLAACALVAGERRSVRLSRRTLEREHGYHRGAAGKHDTASAAAACAVPPPGVCGLHTVNATREALYTVRLEHRYEEIALPGSGSLTRGATRLSTSASLAGKIFPGAVLRVGPMLPLLVSAAASETDVQLADPYAGPDLVEQPIFALNLQLTAGLYDAAPGRTLVTPSTAVDVADTVPVSVAVAATTVSAPESVTHTPPVGVLSTGDHIVFAGVVGGVAARVGGGKSGASPLAGPFALQAAFPHRAAARQRAFRFLDSSHFPGLAQSVIDAWLARRGVAGPKPEPAQGGGEEDADDLIARLRAEADGIFPASGVDAANAAVVASLLCVRLPGSVTAVGSQLALQTTADLTGFVAPGSVLRIGARAPFVVAAPASALAAASAAPPEAAVAAAPPAPDASPSALPAAGADVGGLPALTITRDAVVLDSPYVGPSGAGLPVYRLLEVEALPGRATLARDAGTGAVLPVLSTSVTWEASVTPGDVLLVTTQPLSLVTVAEDDAAAGAMAAAAGGTAAAAAAAASAVSPAAVRLAWMPPSLHKLPPSPAATGGGGDVGDAADAGLRAFRTGLRLVTGCTATLEPAGDGSPAARVVVAGCDARDAVQPADEVFVGEPGSWRTAPLLGTSTAAAAAPPPPPAPGTAPALLPAVAAAVADVAPDAPSLGPPSAAPLMPLVVAAAEGGGAAPAVGADAFRLAAAYAGPRVAAGAPLYRSGAQRLPGAVTVSLGALAALAVGGFDPRPYVQSGDLLAVGAWLPLTAAGGALAALQPRASSALAVGFMPSPPASGGAGAAAVAAAVEATLAASSTGVSAAGFLLTDPFPLAPPALTPGGAPDGAAAAAAAAGAAAASGARGFTVRRLPLRLLPGRVAVAAGSAVVFASADLRQYLAAGTPMRVLDARGVCPVPVPTPAMPPTLLAGGSSSSSLALQRQDFPVGPSRLTLKAPLPAGAWTAVMGVAAGGAALGTRPYAGESVGGSAAGPGGGGFAVTRCPTLPVLSPLAAAAMRPEDRVALASHAAECAAARALEDRRLWVPAYLDRSRQPYAGAAAAAPGSSGAPVAELPGAPAAGAEEELAWRALPGTVAVVGGSAIVSTSEDLTGYLAVGDVVAIGATSRAGLSVAAPGTHAAFRLTAPYPGPTASGLPAWLQYRRVRLSCTLDVEHGSPYARAHADLRGEVAAGDTLELVTTASGTRVARRFLAVPPLTAAGLTLSEAYPGAHEAGVAAFRLVGGAGPGLLLPGTVSVTAGLDMARTSEDLSGAVRAGDRLRIATLEVQAAEPITPDGFSLAGGYGGTTASGLRVYNLGRTSRQLSLEQLGRLKLQCRSIFCLAKLEEMERAVPTDITRSLNAAALLPAAGGGSGADVPDLSAVGARAQVLADEAAAEAAVEREWRAWFVKAKAQLGLVETPGAGGVAPGGVTGTAATNGVAVAAAGVGGDARARAYYSGQP